MNTLSLKKHQDNKYHNDINQKRHTACMDIVSRHTSAVQPPAKRKFKALAYHAYLTAARTKHGQIKSLCMHTPQAAVALLRSQPDGAFTVLGKTRHKGTWRRVAETLPGGTLAEALNAAQAYLKARTNRPVDDKYYDGVASDRATHMLGILGLGLPNRCTSGVVSALIHAKHFAAAYEAAYAGRPSVNGIEAREISIQELEASI